MLNGFEPQKSQMVKTYAETGAILKSMGLTDEAIEYALKACTSSDNNSARYGLNATEGRLLSMIGDGIYQSSEEAAAVLSVSARTVERAIRSLREKGLIEREGSNKSGKWRITDDKMSG